MKLATSAMADLVTAWFERFELGEVKHDEKVFPADRLVIEVIQRADQARRRAEWKTALRDCHLALTAATGQQSDATGDETDTDAHRRAIYTKAAAHLYLGVVLLDNSAVLKKGATGYLGAALRQCQKSAEGFHRSKSGRAEGIAWAAIGLINAGRRKWADALSAFQQGVAVIDEMAPLDSSLKELRRQITQMIPMILDCYEQEAGPDHTG
jgi:hypothetical protein